MIARLILSGIMSYVPGISALRSGGGSTSSARYCYSVWLRHLALAHRCGLCAAPPRVVVELGPGDSLGVGVAALLSGAERCYAFDAKRRPVSRASLETFDELVALFEQREDIPGEGEFPTLGPRLESYAFPSRVLRDETLTEALRPARVDSIRSAVRCADGDHGSSGPISYVAPWSAADSVAEASVDMVLSQVVLEYVDDVRSTCELLYRWVRPGGFTSHQIDLTSGGRTAKWNGHWGISPGVWKLVKGRRSYYLNRLPHSAYVELLKETGFEVACDLPVIDRSGLAGARLSPTFRNLSEEDLTTRAAFIVAVKP